MTRLYHFCLTAFFVMVGLSAISFGAEPASDEWESLNRHRALGQAYMEAEDHQSAIAHYEKAAAIVPDSASDIINLGIANYHGGHNEESIRLLKKGLELDPENCFAFYSLGLAHKKIGASTPAVDYFQQVAGRDASDAATLYNLGLALSKINRDDEAAEWFKKTLALDPEHSSAVYRLLLHARIHLKNMKLAMEYNNRFRELKKDEDQRPADAVDEGKFLGPIPFTIALEDRPKLTSELTVRYVPKDSWTKAIAQSLDSPNGQFLAAIPDLEKRLTALVVSGATGTRVLLVSEGGKVLQKSVVPGGPWLRCEPADYDNDNNTDLLLMNETQTQLFHNDGKWTFNLINASLGPNIEGTADAFWADFDHEGDLDILLARPEAGDLIFQNNGDGSFTNVTGTIEGLDAGKSYTIAVTDLDNDNDLDIIRLGSRGIEVFENQREVRFKKTVTQKHERTVLNPKLIAADFDNDGQMEITCSGMDANGPLAWKVEGDRLTPLDLKGSNKLMCLLAVLDANNDGFEDFLFESNPLGGTGFKDSLLESNPVQSYLKSSALYLNQLPLLQFKLDSASLSNLDIKSLMNTSSPIAADLDFDGDLDLLASIKYKNSKYVHELVALENQGGNQNKSLTLKLLGAKNSADGYGSKIMVKDGLFRVKKEVNSPVTHIGLGARENIDVLRITWPNGIFQNQIKAATAQILSVTEKPGYAGSCPFIYTWNGERYEFISDSLCTGPLGLYVGGGYFPFDPDEYIRIRSDQIQPKNGYYEMLVREELREIIYLEQLELLSASHPVAEEIFVNERFTTPPFPEFKLIGRSSKAHPPKRVTDSSGSDVTELLTENDYRYPPTGASSRYTGISELHWFEIDPGDLGGSDRVYLYLTGYLNWPDSSNARALWQNPSLDFVMPYLQVKDELGEWVTVRNPMGFPAGKLKTVPLDITDVFLSDDRTLRIVSTVQVHWDRILIDPAPILDGFQLQHHPYQKSELRYGGYARHYELGDDGPRWYDYNHRTTNARWDYHRGFFTRYGDVSPLLTGFDDRYVIMQHGDELAATFKATPISESHSLTFFLHITGWVKDLDSSTAVSQSVDPLPFRGMTDYPYGDDESYPFTDENLEYLAEYNTRQITRPDEPLTLPLRIEARAEDRASRVESE